MRLTTHTTTGPPVSSRLILQSNAQTSSAENNFAPFDLFVSALFGLVWRFEVTAEAGDTIDGFAVRSPSECGCVSDLTKPLVSRYSTPSTRCSRIAQSLLLIRGSGVNKANKNKYFQRAEKQEAHGLQIRGLPRWC